MPDCYNATRPVQDDGSQSVSALSNLTDAKIFAVESLWVESLWVESLWVEGLWVEGLWVESLRV